MRRFIFDGRSAAWLWLLSPAAWVAQGGQLSMQFAGGGNSATLAPGGTAQIDIFWAFGPLDTKSRVTNLEWRFNVESPAPGPSGLTVTAITTPIAGWVVTATPPAPGPLDDLLFQVGDPNGVTGPAAVQWWSCHCWFRAVARDAAGLPSAMSIRGTPSRRPAKA